MCHSAFDSRSTFSFYGPIFRMNRHRHTDWTECVTELKVFGYWYYVSNFEHFNLCCCAWLPLSATHFGHNGVCVCVCVCDRRWRREQTINSTEFCLSKWLCTLLSLSTDTLTHKHTHSGAQQIFVSEVSIIHKFARQERPWQFIEIDWVYVCVWVSPSHGNVFKTVVSELFKQIHVFVHSDQREFMPKNDCAWYLMWHQGQGKTTMTTTTTWMVTIRTKQCDANTFSRNSQQSHTSNWCVCVSRLNENRRCDRQLIRSGKTEILDEKVRCVRNATRIWILRSVFD